MPKISVLENGNSFSVKEAGDDIFFRSLAMLLVSTGNVRTRGKKLVRTVAGAKPCVSLTLLDLRNN